MAAARIASARIAAAHGGSAELIVTLAFENGGASEVSLDSFGSRALMEACGATGLEDLPGHDWEKVREALAVSYNRYQKSDGGVRC